MGFGVQNAMKDWQGEDYGHNGNEMGIGIYRSGETGAVVKSVSGQERQIKATEGGALTLQNPTKLGNGRVPGNQ